MSVPALRFKEFSGDWEVKVFADILIKNRLGGNYANSENETNYPLIKMGNLDRGNIKLNKIEYIIQDEVINPEDKINYGDLFFNTRNTLDLVGKVAIWRNELPKAYYNSNLMLIKFDNNFFMNYRLNSHNGMESLKAIATGTTSVAAIYTKDLLKIKLEIPSLPEQTKIANFLTAVDEKISILTQKATLLSQYKKGVMQQIFSQELRFKDDDGQEFPEWEEEMLKNLVISPITYGVVKPGDSDNANGIKLIRGGDILQGKINKNLRTITHEISKQYQRTILQGGELLVSLVGNPGEVAIVTKELIGANLARQVGLVRLTEEINSTFTLYYLMFTTQAIISKVTGSVQKVINLEDLQKVIIKYPSLPEQTKIANFFTAIDEKITTNQTQLNAVKQYKQGLLQQMFV